MRRALRRVRDGAVLNVDEAAVLLAARGDDLRALCEAAGRVRDAGLAAERPVEKPLISLEEFPDACFHHALPPWPS